MIRVQRNGGIKRIEKGIVAVLGCGISRDDRSGQSDSCRRIAVELDATPTSGGVVRNGGLVHRHVGDFVKIKTPTIFNAAVAGDCRVVERCLRTIPDPNTAPIAEL